MNTNIYRGMQLFLALFSIVLNICGLIAISSYNKKTNQNLILAFLSITEILSSIVLCVLSFSTDLILQYTCVGLQITCIGLLILNMVLLTVDRFICLLNPLKHRSRLPRKRIIIVLIMITVFALANALHVSIVFFWRKMGNRYYIYIGQVFNVGFVLFSIATYSLAFYRARKSVKKFRTEASHNKEKTRKLFLVPGIIIATYLLFYTIPQLANYKKVLAYNMNFDPVFKLIPQIGYIADPLTYVFLCGYYRKAFLKRLRSILRLNSQDRNKSDVTELSRRYKK